MKRGLYIILILLILLPLIKATSITGQASSQETGVSVFVLPAVPLLEIISPQEGATYETDEYILLDYTAVLIDTVWYNLDNTNNITINSSLYFTASIGTHTLYLYGNQSNGTILSDNVTFTVSAPPTDGGKKVVIEEIGITLEEEIINVVLKQGETEFVRLLVRNDYKEGLNINLEDLNLDDLLIDISDTEFYLNQGESKEIDIKFIVSIDKIPDLYIEKILLSTPNSQKEIIFYVEVESKEALFDVEITIPKDPQIYKPGEELIANVDFYNLGGIGEIEVKVEYLIKDLDKNILFGEKQTLIIGTSMSLTKTFKIPKNTEDGNYIFYVKATYQGKTASASKSFIVSRESILERGIKDISSRIKEGLKNLPKEFEKDKKEIITAFAIACGLYLFLGIIEYLFGPTGRYHLLKRKYYRGKRRAAKKIIRKRVIKKKSRVVAKRKAARKKVRAAEKALKRKTKRKKKRKK